MTVTAADVRAIIETDMSDSVIEALIDQAWLIVDRCMAKWSDDLADAIVTWVTAHLIASTSSGGVVTQRRLGDAQETYQRVTSADAKGLAGTSYGQAAILMDHTQCLSRLGKDAVTVKVL